MKIAKIDFSYTTNVVSQPQFDAHMKLYGGYVDKINEIDKTLLSNPESAAANAVYSHYRGLKKGETFALNGVILHEEYFANLGNSHTAPGPATTQLINQFFGNYDNWLADFTATAMSARGWCITAFDQRSHTIHNFLQDAHDDGVITMAFPIIVLDMYEHAYFMDYGTNKADYIHKFINNLNWSAIEARAAKIAAII